MMWISLKAVVFDYFPFFVYVPAVILNIRIPVMLRRTDSKAVINKLSTWATLNVYKYRRSLEPNLSMMSKLF